MREAIVGPVQGLYVVAYASPDGGDDDLYVGGFKVYPFLPLSSRVEGCVAEHVSKVRYPSPEVAVHHNLLKGTAAAQQLAVAHQTE